MEVARREDRAKNIRWTDEEVELVARAEVAEQGARFINQAVLAHFQEWNIDQIRYIRKTDRYRMTLRRLKEDQVLGDQAASPDPPVNDGETTPGGSASEPPGALPDNACRESIGLWAAEQISHPGPQLVLLLKRIADRGEEHIASELQRILMDSQASNPAPTGDGHLPETHRRRRKANTDTSQGSKRQMRRFHYARMQALYVRRRSEAAKAAIEGTWDKSNMPKFAPEEIISYWRRILEGPKVEDWRSPSRRHPIIQEAMAPVTELEATALLKELPLSAPGPTESPTRN